jgi:hypothetical protein
VLVSVGDAGQQVADQMFGSSVGRHGRQVAFYTRGAMVAQDQNGIDDIYLRDIRRAPRCL